MNKRIISVFLCLVMVFTMVASAIPVFAAPTTTCTYTVTANKTSANRGEEITYTVSLQQTGKLNTYQFKLDIPAGLTYVVDSGVVAGDVTTKLGFTSSWNQGTVEQGVFIPTLKANGYSNISFEGTDSVELLTFKCVVDDDAQYNKSYDVTLKEIESCDEAYELKLDTLIPATVTVTEPVKPAATVTSNPTARSLTYTGGEQALVTTGTASGGTMQYVMNTTDSQPSTGWSPAVPVATNAGTYYVWYKVAGNANHSDSAVGGPVEVKINKATPDVTAPAGLPATYGQTLANVDLPDGWTWEDEPTTSVGKVGTNTFKATYTPTDSDNYNTVTGVDVTVQVSKAAATVTAPTAKLDLIYNGRAQELVNEGSATGGEMQYSLNGSTYFATIPTAKNAGEYTVYYKVVGDANHNGMAAQNFTVTIAQKTLTVNWGNTSLTYTGNAQKPTATLSGVEQGDIVTVAVSGAQTNVGNNYTATAAISGAAVGNYKLSSKTTTFSITKAVATVTDTPNAKTLTYNGRAQALVNEGSATGGTMQYRLGETGTWGTAIPTATDAGTYKVYYKVFGDANHSDVAEQSVTVTIAKAKPTVTAPTAKDLTYTGSAQALVNAGSTTGGTMQYRLGETGTWGTAIPSATEAGTYKVYYKVVGDNNYEDVAEKFVNVTIGKKAATVANKPTANDLTYSGSAQALVNAGTANGGEMQYSLDGSTYSATIPKGTNAGTYTVYYKVVGDANHNDSLVGSVTVTIAKADATYTAPEKKLNLTYDKTAQALVTAGSANGGEMQYYVGTTPSGTFTADVPTAVDAGTYKVWFKVVGDANHNDIPADFVTVTIAKATPSVTAPTANTLTYNGEDQELVAAGSTTGGTMQYSLDGSTYSATIPTAKNAGTYKVYYKVVGGSNYNDVDAASVTVTIAKATPTVTAPVPVSGLVSTGGELTLINAGATTGGTMQYALGTENAVTGAWGTDLPKGTAAGDYYVWYQVEGDNNYNDVDPKFVKVTIADAGSTPVVLVTGVALDKGTMTLTVGGSSKLTATVDPADATNKAVTWISSNPAVATVDENGNVTAVGVGTVTITVTTADGGFTATCVVTVNAAGGSGGGSGSGGGGHYWHYDYNSDGKCDHCGSKISCKHTDANKDGYCDNCYRCMNHKDKNNDGYCDSCKNKIVESGKTFDAGVALYAGMAALAATGSAVVIGKKRKSK